MLIAAALISLQADAELVKCVSIGDVPGVRRALNNGANVNLTTGAHTPALPGLNILNIVHDRVAVLRVLLVAGVNVKSASECSRPYPLDAYIGRAIQGHKASDDFLECVKLFVLAGGHVNGKYGMQHPQGFGKETTLRDVARWRKDERLLGLLNKLEEWP